MPDRNPEKPTPKNFMMVSNNNGPNDGFYGSKSKDPNTPILLIAGAVDCELLSGYLLVKTDHRILPCSAQVS